MIDCDLIRMKLPAHVREPNPDIYRSDNYVTLDFETTVIGKGLSLYPDNRIVLACWELGPGHPDNPGVPGATERGHHMRHQWGGEFDMAQLVADIERADFLVAHNAKFELGWLARCGLDIAARPVWDTMLGEYVIGGNRWRWQQLSLESSGQRRLGEGKHSVVSKLFKAGLCSTEIPESWLLNYCRQDVRLSRKLMLAQRAHMIEDGALLPVMFTRCLATPVLTETEHNGMYLDVDAVTAKCAELETEYAAVQRQLEVMTNGINLNSPIQLRAYLYSELRFSELTDRRGNVLRTDSGLQRTDQNTLEKLTATTAAQKAFLETYQRSKELFNELTKYLRKFRECSEEVGGWLRGQFNQTNTQTHRLSSNGLDYSVQFQNFPRAYKPLFRARTPGWLVAEADGAQLEFRIAAHLGRDPVALGDIVAGTDIHSVTAGVIGCSRQDAKPHTFKPLYGGRSGEPAEVRYYEFFRAKYKGITARQQEWINTVLESGKLRTEWGLTYYWPDTKMERSGYVKNSTSICNYPVQAFATAEIIPIALVYFWYYIKAAGLQMFIVNTVHDSIVVETPPEEVETFHSLARVCLIDEVYDYLQEVYGVKMTVPLGVGVVSGERWGAKNEVKYEATEEKYGSTV